MRNLVVALSLVALAGAAHAQEARRPFGLGVAVVPPSGLSTVEIYAPITVSPRLRLEPSFGISYRHLAGSDRADVTAGLGVFFVQPVAAPVDLYLGGRVGLDRRGVGADETGLFLVGAIGAEHHLATHFSLGAEAQLGYRNRSVDFTEGYGEGVYTAGLALLRFYF